MNGQFSIIKIITSAGIAGVAVFAIFVLWNLNSNDIEHLQRAVEKQTEIYAETQRETNKVLTNMTVAIEKMSMAVDNNTQVLRTLYGR